MFMVLLVLHEYTLNQRRSFLMYPFIVWKVSDIASSSQVAQDISVTYYVESLSKGAGDIFLRIQNLFAEEASTCISQLKLLFYFSVFLRALRGISTFKMILGSPGESSYTFRTLISWIFCLIINLLHRRLLSDWSLCVTSYFQKFLITSDFLRSWSW